jgi:hypothetical protein
MDVDRNQSRRFDQAFCDYPARFVRAVRAGGSTTGPENVVEHVEMDPVNEIGAPLIHRVPRSVAPNQVPMWAGWPSAIRKGPAEKAAPAFSCAVANSESESPGPRYCSGMRSLSRTDRGHRAMRRPPEDLSAATSASVKTSM